jgi:hypothetical protein
MKWCRGKRARVLVLAMLRSGAKAAGAASDPSAVEVFKKFLSTPPSVERIVFSQREPPDPQHPSRLDLPLTASQSFRYYEGRYDGRAFLLRELPDPSAALDLKTRGLFVADDGISSWFHSGQSSWDRIIDFASGPTNGVHKSAYVVSHKLRQVLMLGM